MVSITYFMVSVTFTIDYYISGWKDSPPFPLQTYVLESVSNDECSFSAAFSSNIWKFFMEESEFWYSFTAALILESLYSCSTDRKRRSPLSRDRYITAAELSGCLPSLSRMIFLSGSINRSKLSDGPVLGPHQIGKKGKRKLVRSSNAVNVRKRIWPNYRHLLQISLCLELKGTFFILLMSSLKIEFIASASKQAKK